MYSSDIGGCIKQWSIKEKKLNADFGKIHGEGPLKVIKMSRCGNYMFSVGLNGYLKQWAVRGAEICLAIDWGKMSQDEDVEAIQFCLSC